MWQEGCVAEGLCGRRAVWQEGCVAGGLCDRRAVWQASCVAGGLCGRWVVRQTFANSPLPSALCLPPTALCPLPSALCPLPTALCPLPSALSLPSAFCPPPFDHRPLTEPACDPLLTVSVVTDLHRVERSRAWAGCRDRLATQLEFKIRRSHCLALHREDDVVEEEYRLVGWNATQVCKSTSLQVYKSASLQVWKTRLR